MLMINWPKTIQLLPLATTLVRSKSCRYNISGFVEELPQLPEKRSFHSCAALPSTGVNVIFDTGQFNLFRPLLLLGVMTLIQTGVAASLLW